MVDHAELLRKAFDLHFKDCGECNGSSTDRFCAVGKRLFDNWRTDETRFGEDLDD